ncbi:MAG: hypothetical protein KatS3mg076_0402 [Candidatus Binatia bacterium]|nr:MAG: hypothetical protein KatS3mg076_0402 [Candidatus Binatia bacterium]
MRIFFGALVLLSLVLAPPRQSRGAEPEKKASQADPEAEFRSGLRALSRGELDEAEASFRRVLELDPKSFEAHNNLAVVLAEQGKDEQALEELRAALELRPGYLRGRKNLAQLYLRLASRAYREAAELAPPEEKKKLLEMAERVARGEAIAEEEGPAEPSRAEPVPPPEVQGVPAAVPQYLLFLGRPGQSALEIRTEFASLYRQRGEEVELVGSYPVRVGANFPARRSLYLPSKENAEGFRLEPVEGSAVPLVLVDRPEPGPGEVSFEPAHLATVRSSLGGPLSPVLALPTEPLPDPEQTRREILAAFERWHDSWARKDLEGYVSSYVPTYSGTTGSPSAWRHQRKRIFAQSGKIRVEHSPPVVVQLEDRVLTLTEQEYRSDLIHSRGIKLLAWVRTPSGWKITEERMLAESPVR